MNPCTFFKCLADDTRLRSVLIIAQTQEACVCDLMNALGLDQPKTSRHLAQLRKCGILEDERRGKWVYYKIHPTLPQWAKTVIEQTASHNSDYFNQAIENLESFQLSPTSCD